MIKLIEKSLENLNEVKEALLSGKKVWYKQIDGYRYLLYSNGMINCYKENNELVILNYHIFNDGMYFLKEKVKIKMKLGKFYKTRNGKKAICVSHRPKKGKKLNYLMYILGDKDGMSFWVDEQGCANKADLDFPLDIVNYWS